MSNLPPASLRCPTCQARQEWSDTCRRCKCDLRLLRAADQAYERNRIQCLTDLRDNRPLAAIICARECERLRPGDDSRKLLAVCALAAGDWATARLLAR